MLKIWFLVSDLRFLCIYVMIYKSKQ